MPMIGPTSNDFALPGFTAQNSLIGSYDLSFKFIRKDLPNLAQLVISTVNQTCYDNCIKGCPQAGPERKACLKGCNYDCSQTCNPWCSACSGTPGGYGNQICQDVKCNTYDKKCCIPGCFCESGIRICTNNCITYTHIADPFCR